MAVTPTSNMLILAVSPVAMNSMSSMAGSPIPSENQSVRKLDRVIG